MEDVIIELDMESGEKIQVATPFRYETLRDALDYPEEDCPISQWVSELNLQSLGAEEGDLVASWDVPMTV